MREMEEEEDGEGLVLPDVVGGEGGEGFEVEGLEGGDGGGIGLYSSSFFFSLFLWFNRPCGW